MTLWFLFVAKDCGPVHQIEGVDCTVPSETVYFTPVQCNCSLGYENQRRSYSRYNNHPNSYTLLCEASGRWSSTRVTCVSKFTINRNYCSLTVLVAPQLLLMLIDCCYCSSTVANAHWLLLLLIDCYYCSLTVVIAHWLLLLLIECCYCSLTVTIAHLLLLLLIYCC